MRKRCRCGTERTEGFPIYCHLCLSFTHTAYMRYDESEAAALRRAWAVLNHECTCHPEVAAGIHAIDCPLREDQKAAHDLMTEPRA